ncbi:hypothetical protein WT81_27905 [Burkholderia stagnalis]|nr:hypothetical protein WT81_27905 [Burkholderia stagnalis]KWK53083.1 hypothetical protein WT80_08325 [Burkholderia stagnalis]
MRLGLGAEARYVADFPVLRGVGQLFECFDMQRSAQRPHPLRSQPRHVEQLEYGGRQLTAEFLMEFACAGRYDLM